MFLSRVKMEEEEEERILKGEVYTLVGLLFELCSCSSEHKGKKKKETNGNQQPRLGRLKLGEWVGGWDKLMERRRG